jgi:hypothetical protein
LSTPTGGDIRSKRVSAGIAGHVLCKKLSVTRSHLSDVERGYVTLTPEEYACIEAALDGLIYAKRIIQQTAAALGWPVSEVR